MIPSQQDMPDCCPHCEAYGKIVFLPDEPEAFERRCSVCGYDFRNLKKLNAIESLQEQILAKLQRRHGPLPSGPLTVVIEWADLNFPNDADVAELRRLDSERDNHAWG